MSMRKKEKKNAKRSKKRRVRLAALMRRVKMKTLRSQS